MDERKAKDLARRLAEALRLKDGVRNLDDRRWGFCMLCGAARYYPPSGLTDCPRETCPSRLLIEARAAGLLEA